MFSSAPHQPKEHMKNPECCWTYLSTYNYQNHCDLYNAQGMFLKIAFETKNQHQNQEQLMVNIWHWAFRINISCAFGLRFRAGRDYAGQIWSQEWISSVASQPRQPLPCKGVLAFFNLSRRCRWQQSQRRWMQQTWYFCCCCSCCCYCPMQPVARWNASVHWTWYGIKRTRWIITSRETTWLAVSYPLPMLYLPSTFSTRLLQPGFSRK